MCMLRNNAKASLSLSLSLSRCVLPFTMQSTLTCPLPVASLHSARQQHIPQIYSSQKECPMQSALTCPLLMAPLYCIGNIGKQEVPIIDEDEGAKEQFPDSLPPPTAPIFTPTYTVHTLFKHNKGAHNLSCDVFPVCLFHVRLKEKVRARSQACFCVVRCVCVSQACLCVTSVPCLFHVPGIKRSRTCSQVTMYIPGMPVHSQVCLCVTSVPCLFHALVKTKVPYVFPGTPVYSRHACVINVPVCFQCACVRVLLKKNVPCLLPTNQGAGAT